MHSTNNTTLNSVENSDESAALFSDVDFLGDLYTQSTSEEVLNTRSKFLPKARNRKLSKFPDVVQENSTSNTSILISPTSLASETSTLHPGNAPINANGSGVEAELQVPTLASSLEYMEDNCFKHDSPVDPCFLMVQDPENGFPDSESLLPESNINSERDNETLDEEETVDLSMFASLDDAFSQPFPNLACNLGKISPKLSSRRKDQQLDCISSARDSFHHDMERSECPNQIDGVEIHVDASAGWEGHLTQPKPAKKVDFQTETLVHGVGEKEVSRSGEEPRKSSRLRKKVQFNVFPSNEDEQDACDGQSGTVHPPIHAENQRDDCNDTEFIWETGRHEQPFKNTKAPSNGTEKSTRKHKQPGTSSSGEQAPVKKKFSHSTKRTRRQVDKKLLEIPEEDIDVRKLPLKDLILLTEARERMYVKAGAPEQPKDNKSHHQDFSFNRYDEDDGYMEGNDYDNDNEEIAPETKVPLTKLNYHTYMKRPPSSRWTKMETEMFYQAIRQFGTDFSMIQQLFPGRTRQQMRLKFKNEERKHPLQIADAISHPSKDYSHFKELIQRLQAQAEEEASKEPEVDTTDAELDATGANEEGSMKKSDGEQDAYEMDGYNPTKYDDYHDGFDWDDIRNVHGQSSYTGKDDFDDTYNY